MPRNILGKLIAYQGSGLGSAPLPYKFLAKRMETGYVVCVQETI